MMNSSAMALSSDVPGYQALTYQVPAIDHDEQEQLERQRDGRRRKHLHAEGHQDVRHHHVDDQKWNEDDEADLKGLFQLRDHERRDDDHEVFGSHARAVLGLSEALR